jgi:hypothetical protein
LRKDKPWGLGLGAHEGPHKNKSDTPWQVGGSAAKTEDRTLPPPPNSPSPLLRNTQKRDKKIEGNSTVDFLPTLAFFFVVFVNPLAEKNSQNTTKPNRGKPDIGFFIDLVCKFLRHRALVKLFCGLFELPSSRNAQKR